MHLYSLYIVSSSSMLPWIRTCMGIWNVTSALYVVSSSSMLPWIRTCMGIWNVTISLYWDYILRLIIAPTWVIYTFLLLLPSLLVTLLVAGCGSSSIQSVRPLLWATVPPVRTVQQVHKYIRQLCELRQCLPSHHAQVTETTIVYQLY